MRNKIASKIARKYVKKSSVNLELHIYDFDGTLFKSPEEPEWWSKSRYGYWYTNEASLGYPFVPVKPSASFWNREVVRDAQDSINDYDVWSILCTGRIDTPPLRYRIAELLKGAGLDFEEVHLNNMGGSTISYKTALAEKMLQKFPNISKIQMWEDSVDNLRALEAVCDRHGISFEGHLIQEPNAGTRINEMEYIEVLREELPTNEWLALEKKLIKKGIL